MGKQYRTRTSMCNGAVCLDHFPAAPEMLIGQVLLQRTFLMVHNFHSSNQNLVTALVEFLLGATS